MANLHIQIASICTNKTKIYIEQNMLESSQSLSCDTDLTLPFPLSTFDSIVKLSSPIRRHTTAAILPSLLFTGVDIVIEEQIDTDEH